MRVIFGLVTSAFVCALSNVSAQPVEATETPTSLAIIDFAPLQGIGGEGIYWIRVFLEASDGTVMTQSLRFERPNPSLICHTYAVILSDDPNFTWKHTRNRDSTRLTVYAYTDPTGRSI